MNDLEDAFRAAGGTIEHLVRAIVRDELRRHLGPEADHFINVKDAPMKATKLRALIRSGELRGYKHGRDVFVAASDLRAFIQGRPVEPPRPIEVREPPADRNRNQDLSDELSVQLGIAPKDPSERRASRRDSGSVEPREVNAQRRSEPPRSGATSQTNARSVNKSGQRGVPRRNVREGGKNIPASLPGAEYAQGP